MPDKRHVFRYIAIFINYVKDKCGCRLIICNNIVRYILTCANFNIQSSTKKVVIHSYQKSNEKISLDLLIMSYPEAITLIVSFPTLL